MSYLIDDPGCAASIGGNTGNPGCTMMPKNFVGAFLVRKDQAFDAADLADILTELQTRSLAAASVRLYPVGRFEEVKDNSEDITYQTYGYGGKYLVKEGRYDWTFSIVNGGLCHHKQFRKFHGSKDFAVILYDADNTLYFNKKADGDYYGFSLENFNAIPWKVNDGSKGAAFDVHFALADPRELNDNVAYVKVDQSPFSSVPGILDVTLSIQTAFGTGTMKVTAKKSCSKEDLYDEFQTEIAAAGAWVLKDDAGNTKTITSVTADATVGGWIIAATLGADNYTLSLATPAALAALNIGGPPDTGFESNVLSFTV